MTKNKHTHNSFHDNEVSTLCALSPENYISFSNYCARRTILNIARERGQLLPNCMFERVRRPQPEPALFDLFSFFFFKFCVWHPVQCNVNEWVREREKLRKRGREREKTYSSGSNGMYLRCMWMCGEQWGTTKTKEMKKKKTSNIATKRQLGALPHSIRSQKR